MRVSKTTATKEGRERSTDDCIFNASSTSIALRRFPLASSVISRAASSGKSNFSFLATYLRQYCIYRSYQLRTDNEWRGNFTSSNEGAATRINRQRLLIGAINLLVLFAQRMILIFDMYFSIVLRRAAWASRDRESASLIITTIPEGVGQESV